MARHPPVGGVHTKMRLDSMEKFFGSQGLTSLPGKLQLASTYTCCYVQYYTGRHPASLCNICITLTLHCALSMQYRWLHAIVLCCALPWWAATAASASQQIGFAEFSVLWLPYTGITSVCRDAACWSQTYCKREGGHRRRLHHPL